VNCRPLASSTITGGSGSAAEPGSGNEDQQQANKIRQFRPNGLAAVIVEFAMGI
jgi:hypothetical protein